MKTIYLVTLLSRTIFQEKHLAFSTLEKALDYATQLNEETMIEEIKIDLYL